MGSISSAIALVKITSSTKLSFEANSTHMSDNSLSEIKRKPEKKKKGEEDNR